MWNWTQGRTTERHSVYEGDVTQRSYNNLLDSFHRHIPTPWYCRCTCHENLHKHNSTSKHSIQLSRPSTNKLAVIIDMHAVTFQRLLTQLLAIPELDGLIWSNTCFIPHTLHQASEHTTSSQPPSAYKDAAKQLIYHDLTSSMNRVSWSYLLDQDNYITYQIFQYSYMYPSTPQTLPYQSADRTPQQTMHTSQRCQWLDNTNLHRVHLTAQV